MLANQSITSFVFSHYFSFDLNHWFRFIVCVFARVCVRSKAAVFLFENSKAYDHLDETACSNLKLRLEQ